nr:MAG TPA: hypothetical protein [Caudoviricetes sp.]
MYPILISDTEINIVCFWNNELILISTVSLRTS